MPPLMSHTCTSLIIHCIDFRLGKPIKKFLELEHYLGDCDIVSVAGAAKNISAPASPAEAEFVLKQVDISNRLHHIETVMLMNHTDCGAYGGRAAFASADAERGAHIADMRNAKEIILSRYPNLTVKLTLANINDSGEVKIETIE